MTLSFEISVATLRMGIIEQIKSGVLIFSKERRSYQDAINDCESKNGHLCEWSKTKLNTRVVYTLDTPSAKNANDVLGNNTDLWTDLHRGRLFNISALGSESSVIILIYRWRVNISHFKSEYSDYVLAIGKTTYNLHQQFQPIVTSSLEGKLRNKIDESKGKIA